MAIDLKMHFIDCEITLPEAIRRTGKSLTTAIAGSMLAVLAAGAAFADVCRPFEYSADVCVGHAGRFDVVRSYPWRGQIKGFAHEFQNRCRNELTLSLDFGTGAHQATLRMPAVADEEDVPPTPIRMTLFCGDDDACKAKPRMSACSRKPIRPVEIKSALIAAPPPNVPSRASNSSAAIPPAQTAPKVESFTIRENYDLAGTDIRTIKPTLAPQCQLACADEAGCVGYTFDRWNAACFLKSQINSIKLEPKAVSGWKEASTQILAKTAIMTEIYTRQRLVGRAFETRTMDSRNACLLACADGTQCLGFTFETTAKQCTLFSQLDNRDMSENAVSGIRRQP